MPTQIRWGILGTGTIARKFAYGLRLLPDARLQAVASRERARAEAFARDVGAEEAHGTYEELARNAAVDVVYVGTPNAAHASHCRLALEHGKAVLCEKPFATSAAEMRDVIALAKDRGLFCMEAMWMRFVPVLRELEACLARREIGEVHLVTAQLGWPVRPDPARPLFDPALGGGALLDLGVYPLSFAFQVLGRPSRVGGRTVIGKTGVDEQAVVHLDFAGGKQAVVAASLRGLLPNDAVLVGTEGMIRVHAPLYCPERFSIVRAPAPGGSPPRRGRIARLARRRWIRRIRSALAPSRATTVTRRTLGEGYAHEAVEVMRCLRAGERESPILPLDESLAVLQAIDDVRRGEKG